MVVKELAAHEVGRFRAIRLAALRSAPTAFGTRFEAAATWDLDVWSRLFAGITVWIAEADHRDVGLVRGAPDRTVQDAARLGSLWVAEAYRGRGAGTALIDAVVQWAGSSGYAQLLLDVTDDNAAAIGLYERRGFVPTGNVGRLPPPREHVAKHERVLTLRSRT